MARMRGFLSKAGNTAFITSISVARQRFALIFSSFQDSRRYFCHFLRRHRFCLLCREIVRTNWFLRRSSCTARSSRRGQKRETLLAICRTRPRATASVEDSADNSGTIRSSGLSCNWPSRSALGPFRRERRRNVCREWRHAFRAIWNPRWGKGMKRGWFLEKIHQFMKSRRNSEYRLGVYQRVVEI